MHSLFWWLCQPLAHGDLNFYTEPAALLAESGRLAGPGSQHLDLTYVRGIYFYPPGYALLLGGWIKLFGFGIRPLLAYTLVTHALYLFLMWLLLRRKLVCTRVAAALALVSIFPMFNHGRPDVTSLLVGVLAWLTIPDRFDALRLCGGGALLGIAVLVSPAFGIGSAAAVGAFFLAGGDASPRHRVKGFAVLSGVAILTFLGIWSAVLSWQGAWSFGPEQFIVNLQNRGRELNDLDAAFFQTRYAFAFMWIPFVLLTFMPAAFILCRRSAAGSRLHLIALSYISGMATALLINKTPFLSGGHFSFIARPAFHGALASSSQRIVRVAGVLILSGFAIAHVYFEKKNLLYLGTRMDGEYRRAAEIKPGPQDVVAVDSHFFPMLYRGGGTINYEVYRAANYWARYRAATSPSTLALLPEANRDTPLSPDVIVVSEMTLQNFGPPDPDEYQAAGKVFSARALELFGISFSTLPQAPLDPYIFYRLKR
ncbi:MAG: hypothetical protein M3416_08400 [Acidobacteriota bacterium]|nr:hypothetical protein [Acidobacteriota bacterium]